MMKIIVLIAVIGLGTYASDEIDLFKSPIHNNVAHATEQMNEDFK